MLKVKALLPIILLLPMMLLSSCSSSQKTSKKSKENAKPDWVMSRPVDRNYYQGVGVAMVNNYTQGHVEEAKQKALNDLISEISVTVKSTSMMQQVERNEELNSMYQNLTKLTAQNDIEGYELVASWGDEKEYWVYYRLSKELYNRNKQRKLDRARSIGSQYYESGKSATEAGNIGRAYEDYVKGLVSLKEYIDAELTILTDNGQEYLVDVLLHELIELNRGLKLETNVSKLEVRIARPIDQEIQVKASYNGRPVSDMALKPYFGIGNGEVPNSIKTDASGSTSFKIGRVTGGQNQQVLEISPDIEGMTAEGEGEDFMSKLIRLKSGVPSAKINIVAKKISAYFESEVNVLGEKSSDMALVNSIKEKLGNEAYQFTSDKSNAEVIVKLTYTGKKGEEFLLKNKTLYTSYVDLFIGVTEQSSGKQVFYKGISGEKGSRAGGFDKAHEAAKEAALERFDQELLPEIGNLNL